jgi:carboxylesterase
MRLRRTDPGAVARCGEILERQVGQLSRLVDDLLDVSRITRGKIALQPRRVVLGTVVARAVEPSQPLIDARRHRIHLSLPPEPVDLEADPARLELALLATGWGHTVEVAHEGHAALEAKVGIAMASLSALLIHGFTAGPQNLEVLRVCLEAAGIRCRVPTLAGHGSRPEDMAGKGWEHWTADVTAAFDALAEESGQVAVVGQSLGGLLALDLAVKRPAAPAALVVLAPAVCVCDPLDGLAPLLARLRRTWPSPTRNSFSAAAYLARCTNYPWFDTAAYVSWRAERPRILANLARVTAPLLVVHSRADRIVPARAAEIVLGGAASPHKEIAWFERSGHEMLLDCEAGAVCARIQEFLTETLSPRSSPTPSTAPGP